MSYANFWQRIFAAAIDGGIIYFSLIIVVESNQNNPVLAFSSLAISFIGSFFLVAFLSVRYSGTPGLLLLGCQIVDAKSGNSISTRQALLRSLGIFLCVLSGGLGFLWIIFTKQKQALHDRIAKTIVVFNGTVDLFDESQKSLKQVLSELR